MSYQVLLYYKYVHLSDPDAYREQHQELCQELGLLGRIIVAEEGINGTVSGTTEATEAYIDAMRDDPRTADMAFKIDPADTHAFPKLSIKVRSEIVSLGLGEEDVSPNERTGVRLSPDEFKQAMDEEGAIVLDGRNDYESALGHFRGALCPDVKNFRDFPAWIRANLGDAKDKKLLTYCTGGIRCEKLSAFLLKEGFKDVSQLDGGIVNYGKDEQVRGESFEGQCYVFDKRIAVDVNHVEDSSKIVSHCLRCGGPSARYVNCRYAPCNDQVFLCEACEGEHGRFCSDACRTAKAAAEATAAG
ncbi:MAG: rhodanese-related sulfurtransferase [Verrucomicrobiales bacterium]